jgi:uncharacterized Zn finger protein (UPF0148 family)
MPHYEFACRSCKKVFTQMLSLVDYEEGDVYCPKVDYREGDVWCPNCGSKDVEQCWSAFDALTSTKAA